MVIKNFPDSSRRLSAFGKPILDTILFQKNLLFFRIDRVVLPHLFEGSAVAGRLGVDDNQPIIGFLLGTESFHSDTCTHNFLLLNYIPICFIIEAWYFLFFANFFMVSRMVSNFFRSLFTSYTDVPLPLATRLRRAGPIIRKFSLSA